MKQTINVAFVGNPNCGKTTLFNAYTGANLKVANWPGVTVERKEGETDYRGQHIKLIDTPGIYSLTSYSIEEKVTRQCILEDDIDVIINIVDASAMERNIYLTMQLLERDDEVEKQYSLDTAAVIDRSYEKDIINQKYDYIEEVVDECLFYKSEKAASTDKIDEVLTHRLWGVPIFLGIMALVFFLTFFIGDALKGVFEIVLSMFSDAVNHLLVSISAADWLISLIVDGIIAGVGGILTFLPNIFILFLALAVLEDSGYMARVAYVMDKIMGRAGLSGKAFLPMILGFGCTVPAVMATRALEREEDRKKTILVTPFMSCSARLPIYVLFADMFFGKYAMAAAFSMYVLGMLTAIVIALVINRFQKNKSSQSLLIELPEYKAPNARTIMIYVWEKVKDYLTKAGTTIFVASIVIWFILNFNQHGMVTEVSESFGAALGRWLEPLLAPAGLGLWQIGVALISGLSAKEVVVSSFAVLFGVGNANSAAGMAQIVQNLSVYGFGALNAYALMVFCLLYTPCAATIGTIRKETHSWKFTFMMIAFQLLLAWGCAVLVFQAGSLLAGI